MRAHHGNSTSLVIDVVIVGSCDMDFARNIDRIPWVGDSVLILSRRFALEGKARTKLSCVQNRRSVSLIACLGGDPFGQAYKNSREWQGGDSRG